MKQEINNDKNTVRLPIVIALTLAGGILLGATFFGGSNKGMGDVSKSATKFREILSLIDRNYVDSVNTDSLAEYSITKMLEKLDPHTYYFPPKDAELARSQLQSGFDGIGVEFNIFKDTVYVVAPLAGGPSETVGIQSGDAIISADGVNLTGKKVDNSLIFSKLRGPRGSQVKLEIKRKAFKDLLRFTITRDKIPSYSIDAAYLLNDKKTGYIKINRFTESTYDEFRTHLDNLKKQGMTQLIMDLRGNPGGYMDRATSIVDELVGGNGIIVYTQGKIAQNDRKTYAKIDGMFEKGQVVVMIDEGSASASEIVSGSLQDYDRAVIVGRRSFGKGLVQQPINLSDGSELRLTISRYYIPSGRSIQKPYEKGHIDAYEQDYDKRRKSGELFVQDSIKFNKKLQFKTLGGRTVYGGGGITPDVFVPRDTSMITKYLVSLYGKSILREFALNYATDNKKSLDNQSFSQYMKSFVVTDKMLADVRNIAESVGIKFNEKEYNRSKEYIKTQLKALIARQIWHKNEKNGLNNEFYQIMAADDEMMKVAIKQFK